MNFLGYICWDYRPNFNGPDKKMILTRWMKYLLLMLAVGCLAAACATPPPISVSEALNNGEDEKMLWRRARKEQQIINGSGLLYRDPELEIYLNRVAQKLQAFTDPADISFDIKVVNDPNVNAVAFPNGVIYIHTGILARLDNEAQLAALLAHEMTHCTHRHSLRVIKSIDKRPGFMAVSQPLRKIAMVQDLARLLGVSGSMAAVTGYTREFEAEADRVGLDLVVKAGYDPRQVMNLFEHLRQEIEIKGIKEPYFFGTHPSVDQRMENAGRWLATEFSGNEAGIKNFEIFRIRVSKLVLDNARLDLRLGRFYTAAKGVKKYLRQNPSDAGAYYLLGEIYRQQGRQDDTLKALGHFEKAIALDPSFPAPHRAIGLMHYKAGQRKLAQKYFESCLLLSPDTPDNAFIQGYLQRCIDGGEKS